MVLIAAGQLSSSSSLIANGKLAVKLIDQAVSKGVKVLFLPEASDYIAKSFEVSKKIVQPVETSPFVLQIQEKLKELHSNGILLEVNVGVHEPSPNDDRLINTSLWFNPRGEIVQRYQKIHLFDVNIPGTVIQESKAAEPGSKVLTPFDSELIPGGKIGLAVCYDLRFPELSLRLRSLGANILSFPSAFTPRTGAAHWHLLARSRAIDTQSYVVLAAQAGGHGTSTDEDIAEGKPKETPTRFSYGHALIVDPWGTIVAEVSDIDNSSESLSLAIADIDLNLVKKTRDNIPLWDQRRPDVFGYNV
ncbi:hypothetical protein WICMUC_002630 [Wickerhamomyces mucosus]|uniref:CN hydrolase domain-containing protein n=1 Tax=Wickerhamomyces mucosus TaxID=1378264 RepID=A0A9P8TE42_9ASCO|nr:hypothetical protein WICMUC_002630 [Wickerhamomyces mucosus]